MNRPTNSEIRAVIKQFILEEVAFGELEADEFADDMSLFERGLLNSLNLVQLIAFLEGRYGFTIQPASIEFENFVDVASVARLVESSLPASG